MEFSRIHGDTIVHILDLNEKNSDLLEVRVKDLFAKHFYASIRSKDTIKIEFNEKVYIADWYGWSNLLTISKIQQYSDIVWNLLVTEQKNEILVCDDTFLQVYPTSTKAVLGFHGEVIYTPVMKRYYDLDTNDRLRVKRNSSSDNPNEFSLAWVSGDPTATCSDYYRIITKSGTFNANDIYMTCGV